MKFIQLTQPKGLLVYFAADRVIQIEQTGASCKVNGMPVLESADDVIALLEAEVYMQPEVEDE
jgi:hypothetical protein